MKILILSRGRTRSTYLQTKLCQTYNLTNYIEKFNKNSYAYSTDLDLKYRNNTQNIDDLRWNHFCKLTLDTRDTFFKTENFAVKLWPRMLLSFPQSVFGKLIDYKPKIITDLSYYTKIKDYDTIYFLDRDITDSVCSWIYATIIKNFLFKNIDNNKDIELLKRKETVTISDNYFPIINYYIYEIALQHKILDFLNQSKLNYVKLDYNEIPNYCNTHLSGIDVYKDYKLNYSEIITNYDSIKNYSFENYQIAKTIVNDINFT